MNFENFALFLKNTCGDNKLWIKLAWPYCIIYHYRAAVVVKEKYGDEDDSDSSSSEIEDDNAHVSIFYVYIAFYAYKLVRFHISNAVKF